MFAKCYAAHGRRDGFVAPRLHFPPTGKGRATYLAAWGEKRGLVSAAPPGALPPGHLIRDFEVAACGAMGAVFPKAQAHLCYFHLGQSVGRKVLQCGPRNRYASHERFEVRTRVLIALAFLPVDQVGQGFGMLEEELSEEGEEIPGF